MKPTDPAETRRHLAISQAQRVTESCESLISGTASLKGWKHMETRRLETTHYSRLVVEFVSWDDCSIPN